MIFSSSPMLLVIATRNRHKVAEVRAILGGGFEYRSLHDFPSAPRVVEDAGSFAGNARKKAVELREWLEPILPQIGRASCRERV